jgi:hypothetical protein
MFAVASTLVAACMLAPSADDQNPIQRKAAQITSQNNMRQLGLAMLNYRVTHRRFPDSTVYSKEGKPLYSWRVQLLPFIEEDKLYKEFKLDEPWDSEHNKKLIERMPVAFAPVTGKEKGKKVTHYQVLRGGGAMFEDKKKLTVADITDGTSNTIMIVEAEEAVPWTKPADVAYDPEKPLPKFGGLFKNGFHAAFADGTVRFIKMDIDEKLLRALITRSGGEKVDLKQLK